MVDVILTESTKFTETGVHGWLAPFGNSSVTFGPLCTLFTFTIAHQNLTTSLPIHVIYHFKTKCYGTPGENIKMTLQGF